MLTYQLWVDGCGSLYVQVEANAAAGKFSALAYPVTKYAAQRNNNQSIGKPVGFDLEGGAERTSENNDDGGFFEGCVATLAGRRGFSMKRLIPLLGISLFSLAVSAQPTSFGGITPGKTSREELKSLAQESDVVGIGNKDHISIHLKQPEGQDVMLKLQNGVVYEVMLAFHWGEYELKSALIEKYGQPKIKVGTIRHVTCKNQLGASFERVDGTEEWRWPVKDGVQGALRFVAMDCAQEPVQGYVLRHVATFVIKESYRLEQERKEAEEKRRKLGDAF